MIIKLRWLQSFFYPFLKSIWTTHSNTFQNPSRPKILLQLTLLLVVCISVVSRKIVLTNFLQVAPQYFLLFLAVFVQLLHLTAWITTISNYVRTITTFDFHGKWFYLANFGICRGGKQPTAQRKQLIVKATKYDRKTFASFTNDCTYRENFSRSIKLCFVQKIETFHDLE